MFKLILITLLLPLSVWAEPLTLNQAYQRILEQSPAISASRKEILIKSAESLQAGLLPNPVLIVAGNRLGAKSVDDSNELFIGLAQLIELGGKRAARLGVANAEELVAYWNDIIFLYDTYTRLMHAFIDTAAAQEKLQLASDQLTIAEEWLKTVQEKAAGGKVAKIEEQRAAISHKGSEVLFQKAQAELEIAKRTLAGLWGSSCIDFDKVDFALYEVESLPPEEVLCQQISLAPDFNKYSAEVTKGCEEIRLQKAYSFPDMTINAGIVARETERDHPVSIGVEIPIPIFNLNQGNREKASIAYAQALDRLTEFEQNLSSKLNSLYTAWNVCFQEVATLKATVVPWALETFQLAHESYKEGKSEYLQLLDAQKTLYEVKLQYLNAIAECQRKKADIDRLEGNVSWQIN